MLKKLVRSAFVYRAFFPAQGARLVFATPKMHAATREAIEDQLPNLTSWLVERWTLSPRDIQLRLVADNDFKNEILDPVLRCASTVADTGELFLRSQQLMALCNSSLVQRAPQSRSTIVKKCETEQKIGSYIQSVMTVLANSEQLAPKVVENLLNAQYCKKIFNLGYPFLRRIDSRTDLSEQRKDERGYARYWKTPIAAGGEQFLVCNQWFAWQRHAFDSWVQELTTEIGRGHVSTGQVPAV